MQVKTVQYGAGERGKRSRVHGELVCGPETLSRGGAREEPLRFRRRDPSRIRSTTTITRRARRSGPRSRCRCSRPPTGAARACIRAAISRASCAPRRSRNGSRRTASSTGRISTPTTAASCSCGSSIISCTARTTAGTSSRGCCCRCATSTSSSSAPRTNGRSRAPNGRSSISIRPACALARERRSASRRSSTFDAMGDGLTFLTPPLARRDRDHRPVARSSCSCRRRPRDADIFVVLRVFTADLQGDRVPGRDRSAYADRAGLAARLAPQARPEAVDALPALSHPRREAAAEAGQVGRARHRDLADLDRGAGRLPHRAHDPRQGLRIWRRQRRQAVELQERTDAAAGRSCTTIRATGRRRSSAAPPPCISARGKAPYLLLPIIPPKEAAAAK